jgi:vacuolar-type H+-ATPase subunit H
MPAENDHEVLTPLDQIRQAEAEITRRIAAARQDADQASARARRQAENMKREALQVGIREGRSRYEEIVSRAEEEAEAILADAKKQAQELRRKGQRRAKTSLNHAVRLVIGADREATDEH